MFFIEFHITVAFGFKKIQFVIIVFMPFLFLHHNSSFLTFSLRQSWCFLSYNLTIWKVQVTGSNVSVTESLKNSLTVIINTEIIMKSYDFHKRI